MMEEKKKKQIAVIGSEEFTLGFELAGVKQIYGKENYQEDMKELLQSDDIGIVVAEKSDVDELPQRIQKTVDASVEPVVVKLSETPATEELGDKIKRAIGIDIT